MEAGAKYARRQRSFSMPTMLLGLATEVTNYESIMDVEVFTDAEDTDTEENHTEENHAENDHDEVINTESVVNAESVVNTELVANAKVFADAEDTDAETSDWAKTFNYQIPARTELHGT
jgi:hypothetical protein